MVARLLWENEPTAAGGGCREASEWQRPTDAKERRRRRQMSGTATGRPKQIHSAVILM